MYTYLTDETAALRKAAESLKQYADLACEYGAREEAAAVIKEMTVSLEQARLKLAGTAGDPVLRAAEPDDYESIAALSKGGNLPVRDIPDLDGRMLGALIGRFAGCTLGIPVEGWASEQIGRYAELTGMPFPPTDYWKKVPEPNRVHYGKDPEIRYQKGSIDGVGVDDDITYTLLAYEILSEYGPDFTTADVGEAWKKYLTVAFTAELAALNNLRAGVPAEKAAETDNPFVQWIGADIRADGFAYSAAGDPHLAAALAYRDAYLSHRRNGIYGEMFFAAAEAAAFTVDDPMEALRIALNEIPENCSLKQDLEWALEACPSVRSFRDAVRAVNARFPGQSPVHTNNNACLTVFGLHLGGRDFTKVISETVAMGYDCDCTAATAGSIAGACIGFDNIPPHWYRDFHNSVRSYMIGRPEYKIDKLAEGFCAFVRERLGFSAPQQP